MRAIVEDICCQPLASTHARAQRQNEPELVSTSRDSREDNAGGRHVHTVRLLGFPVKVGPKK